MTHHPAKNVLREMVQAGVMQIVNGATISAWQWQQLQHQHQQVINSINFKNIQLNPISHSNFAASKM